MREILFRGKDKDGKWHYAMSLSRHVTENGIITSYYIGAGNSIVSAETVGQFTGLTDKNGTKIFEGDIAHVKGINGATTFVVKYGEFAPNMFYEFLARYVFEKMPRTKMFGLYCESLNGEQMLISNVSDIIEVIGNIHDNPELLKKTGVNNIA